MIKIACIVEGHAEVAAFPILLRRIGQWRSPETYVEVQKPIRVNRDRFLNRQQEFSRHLQLARAKAGDNGWVVVLLDADDDCPAELGPNVLLRAQDSIPQCLVSVVFANREYESWFVGSAKSLDGIRGFVFDQSQLPQSAEGPRDAKGWVGKQIRNGHYGETTLQPAFTACFDLAMAEKNCRSFRKLCREWDRHAPMAGTD